MDVETRDEASRLPEKPTHHTTLWFNDGNVVLATDKYLFRVHMSVLSLQSSVFRDMFDLCSSNGEGADGQREAVEHPEMYQGVPKVTLVGDKGEDVAHLLRTAYVRSYYDKNDDGTHLEKIVALILLSSKYDFADIKDDIIAHLRRLFPTELQRQDNREFSPTIFGRDRANSTYILLQAIITANIEIVLPGLFHDCSVWAANSILDKYARHLSDSCLKQLLRGKALLSHEITRVFRLFLEKRMRCAFLHEQRQEVDLAGIEKVFRITSLTYIRWQFLQKEFHGLACKACEGSIKEALLTKRQEIWDKLPSFYSLPSWEQLHERYQGSLDSS